MNESAEDIIRKEAAYFVIGEWPKALYETKISSEILKPGTKVLLAIVPLKDPGAEG